MKLDVARIIKDLGGVEEIVEWINCHLKPGEAKITIKAVEKWRERGNIPMKRWLLLPNMANKRGVKKFKLDNYVLSNGSIR